MKELKSFLNNILTHNIGLKILSLIGAVIVWLVIINIDDPYKTKTFQVTVETINESALQSVNKVFEITSGEIASVKVGGKRSVIDKLDATDIRATANLANLSSVNAVAIEPSLRKKVSSDVTLECTQVLKVSLEDMATKQLKITIVTEGTPADGYTIGNCTAKPNMIQVIGGVSVIKRITTVKVILNVEGASEDFTSRLEPIAYDANDEVVRSDTLHFGEEKIRVRAKVLDNKTIPVRVDVKGKPAPGYEYVGTECLPQEIEIAGTEKKMAAVSELVIPMDISGLIDTSSQLEKTVDVISMLPDGITVAPEYETISVKVTIEALTERAIQIKAADITFRNLGDNLIAEVVNPEELLSIVVTGRTSILGELPDTALNAYIDCNNIKEGIHRLSVQMDLGDACRISRSVDVEVRVTKGEKNPEKFENTTSASPMPQATAAPTTATTILPAETPSQPQQTDASAH